MSSRSMLITGGAGFIGVNAADHFLKEGWTVTLFDNLSRQGTQKNLAWIQSVHGPPLRFIHGDVRDGPAIREAVRGQDAVLHLAAQVAVTTSVSDPEPDFEVNARGTFNVLEAVRTAAPEAPLLFASTNKVYGGLENWTLRKEGVRWLPDDGRRAVSETEPLDFHSPYGCSKGAADQYVHDYARCYGLRTVVFRQSCIYSAHQYGNEDQGWVAHFLHSVIRGAPLTIYGDGFQVRDLLDVRDLNRLYAHTLERIGRAAGQVFNVGGGPDNARSVIEVLHAIESSLGTDARYDYAGWRQGDQLFYVSDVGQADRVLGWRPQIPFETGLEHLVEWARAERAAASAPAG